MDYYGRLSIKIGHILVRFNDTGDLEGLWFENQKYYPQIIGYEQWIGKCEVPAIVDKHFTMLQEELALYETSGLRQFSIPLAPVGTEFRQLIWQLLREIPHGTTTTYGEIGKKAAALMGKETMSAQAVGGAVGHNPISIIIPCHRVVGSDGTLTGYAGGVDKKEWLLGLEGAISSIDK